MAEYSCPKQKKDSSASPTTHHDYSPQTVVKKMEHSDTEDGVSYSFSPTRAPMSTQQTIQYSPYEVAGTLLKNFSHDLSLLPSTLLPLHDPLQYFAAVFLHLQKKKAFQSIRYFSDQLLLAQNYAAEMIQRQWRRRQKKLLPQSSPDRLLLSYLSDPSDTVVVFGDFTKNAWREGIRMKYYPLVRRHLCLIPRFDRPIHFKFRVNSTWRCAPYYPLSRDDSNNENHCIPFPMAYFPFVYKNESCIPVMPYYY